jgi:hypothetical protein
MSLRGRVSTITSQLAGKTYFAVYEKSMALFKPGKQTRDAAEYWASLSDCEIYYTDELGWQRSAWVASQVMARNVGSLLEIGTNSGRNLAAVRQASETVKLKGIDVNRIAIDFAREKNPSIDFDLVDANRWTEDLKSWDAIVTMSLIDHIPDEAIHTVVDNMISTARKYIICVELWDGSEGVRGLYKYSRDLRRLFEVRGVKTLIWEKAVGQYDQNSSPLWAYIGQIN